MIYPVFINKISYFLVITYVYNGGDAKVIERIFRIGITIRGSFEEDGIENKSDDDASVKALSDTSVKIRRGENRDRLLQ